MRSATVKQALRTGPDDLRPKGHQRTGVEYVGPTPATDAVLAGHPVGFGRQLLTEIGLIVGVMVVMTGFLVVMIRGDGQSLTSDGSVLTLGIMVGVTLATVVGLLVLRWRQSRMLRTTLTPAERRCVVATGPVRIQARNAGLGTQEHWLLARESDWMQMDAEMLDAVEPIMRARAQMDGPFDQQSGTDVTQEWTVHHATVLYHPGSGTIIEIEDQHGRLTYRHPDYHPGGA
jgi:hypothetical protein